MEADRRFGGLLRAVTDTPEYRAGGLGPDATALTEATERTARLLPPDVLASALEEATGFRWTFGGWDQLANDQAGYRVMAGGVDGQSVLQPQGEPGLTWTLVTARLAELAAGTVVDAHFDDGEPDTLLAGVSEELSPDDPDFERTLDRLCWALLAEPHDAERNAALAGIWQAVVDTEDAPTAWAAVLTALFRDPSFLAT